MTDSFSLTTHTAPLSRSVPGSIPSSLKSAPSQNSTAISPEEVEDYTIKCICGFDDDDGNTVFCDPCETWQHTECYYIDEHGVVPDKDVLGEIEHFCTDCKPRPLDAKAAVERQKSRRKELDPSDRRVKKTTSKSHKKKIRAPEHSATLTNGCANGDDSDLFHDRTSRSPRDPHAPMKRPKTSHRPSSSMHFPLPTSHPHKRSGSAMHSPSKKHLLNGYTKDCYSTEFLHLYDDDPGDSRMQTNLLNDISITQKLSIWSNDVDELKDATRGSSPQDVFNRCDQPIDSMPLPQLNKEYKEDESVVVHGLHPKWTYLTIDAFAPKDAIVGELKGKIGHMEDYIHDPTNRWDYLRHPAPFVFFHGKLPIYIDTRSEGTTCRYLRRSCDPNLSMKTFLENRSDYHFCFVAKRDLDAGTELTIGWVLDEHIRKHFSPRNPDDATTEGDFDEEYVVDWVGKVLAEFGGCACESPDTCALAKYDRRSTSISQGRNGYSGKHSPMENGYATNSRASSEQADGRSSSGSKSRSRDLTPTHDTPSHLRFGTEISDREKRKIAALEKNFEQLENDKHQPAQKKKKRNSGGTTINTPAAGSSKQLGHTAISISQPNTPGLSLRPQYADASTSRRKSGSPTARSYGNVGRPRSNTVTNSKKRPSHPNIPSVPSPLVRQNYVSSGMQTEPDEDDDWYKPPPDPVLARKHFMSLSKRLLLRSQQDRVRLDEQKRLSLGIPDRTQPNGQQTSSANNVDATQGNQDIDMHDAGSAQPLTTLHMSTSESSAHNTHLPDDDPITADMKPPAVEQPRPLNGFRQNNLHVQMPIKQNIVLDVAASSPLVETPTSVIPQSPFSSHTSAFPPSLSHSSSSLVQPSPIKKKVSLGDYLSRRKSSQPATEMTTTSSPPMQPGAFKQAGESKDVPMQGSAIEDTPKKEEGDPLATQESKDPKL
ncbi:hypothetical protein N7G274_000981 [Stereocaulon virgatum]|uniref:SET domain-containing protein n=1 Tax=Stereocaulon virgatum TaxID=373712 RepID=A0ABR4AMI7_9LECA